ncbi:MAG: thiamine-phosphate kinase [Gammaproteobacteria bacterium]|nr:thiamine-phosphate kinase [Gammaproteobacteria bacterium]
MALGEFELIDRFFREAGGRRGDVVLGVGDDGAILRPPEGCDLIAVSDTLVEGVHFPAGAPARSIGHRALAVNLSDIAAMGAAPAWSLLALTLPRADEAWLKEFAKGFSLLALEHEVSLVGGDTTRGPLMIGVQVLGFVPHDVALRRTGGRPGHLVCVSGTLGDATAGLTLLAPDARAGVGDPIARAALRARFEYPTPRLELGRQLLDIASACIDVSDGLAGDLGKLAAASGCAAVLDLERVPRSEALATLVREGVFDEREALSFMLAGGDDYELAFTVPPENREALSELEARGEVFVIGTLVEAKASEPLVTVRTERTELKPYLDALPSSYDHFNHA